MRQRILAFLLAAFVCASTTVHTATAYSLGENIEFNAGEIETNGGGNINSYQRTDEERQMDWANYTNNSEITDIVREYVESLDKSTQFSEQTDTGYVFVVESDTPTEILVEITEKKDDYRPGGYYYNITDSYTGVTEDNLNPDQYAVLGQAATNRGWDPSYSSSDADADLSVEPGEGLTGTDRLAFIGYIGAMGGDTTRENPVAGNGDLIDAGSHPARYDIIDAYLNFFSGNDTVKTAYILEIKAESISEGALWESRAIPWLSSGQTHYWQFECIESFDGSSPASLDQFGGKNISQTFYFPGKYQVTATQILEESYYDVMTYSINEYWILEDTGVVIWKNESTGRSLNNQTKPLCELNTRLINNYNLVNSGTYYVPVYDAVIEVNSTSWDSSFTAPSIWGYDFTTKRRQ